MKIFILHEKKTNILTPYVGLSRLVKENDIGTSIHTLYRRQWNKPFENENFKIVQTELIQKIT